MEIKTRYQHEEAMVILTAGVDFTAEQLKPDMLTGGRLQYLAPEVSRQLAADSGFDGCPWSGHYQEADGTVAAKFLRRIAPTVSPDTAKEPPEERTAPCGECPLRGHEREGGQLLKLLSEVREYTKESNVQPWNRGNLEQFYLGLVGRYQEDMARQ